MQAWIAAVVARPAPPAERDLPPDLDAKLARLRESLDRTRRRLALQDTVLTGLKEELSAAAARLRGFERIAPAPAPAAVPVPAQAASRGPAARPRRLDPIAWGVLAVLGLALGLGSPKASPPPALARAPAPRAAAPAPAPAEADGLVEEDQSRQATIGLILDYRPQGARGTVGELLGPELESSSDGHPWVLEKTGETSYLVAFRPYGEALGYRTPIYEFEVDLVAGSVKPSPETLRTLVGPGS